MSNARAWVEKAKKQTEWPGGRLGDRVIIRMESDALLAVLDECDRWDHEWAVTNWFIAGHFTPPTAPIRAAIDKALGVTDE